MSGTTRRTRAAVAGFSKVVLALLCAVGKGVFMPNTGREFGNSGGKVVQHPVHPGSSRGIWIVDNQREARGPVRRIFPAQGNRNVCTVTGVLLRNHVVWLECGACQFE